jgi:hypothetical protein
MSTSSLGEWSGSDCDMDKGGAGAGYCEMGWMRLVGFSVGLDLDWARDRVL